MKRLLNSTAALSIALANVQPWPVMAQTLTEEGSIIAEDGTVLCEPTAEAPCKIEDFPALDPTVAAEQAAAAAAAAAATAAAEQAAAEAAAAEQAAADAAAAEQAAAEAAGAAEQAAAEAAAAEAAAAEAAAAAAAAEQAAAEAAAAEQAAADQAAADAAAAADQAAADAAAAEKAAVDQAAADAAAAADQAAADAAAAEKAAADQAAADAAAAADQAAADAAAAEKAASTEAEAVAPVAEAPVTEDPATAEVEVVEPAGEPVAVEEPEAQAPAATPETATTEAVVQETAPEETASEESAAEEPVAPSAAEVEAQAQALKQAQKEIVVQADGTIADPSAGLKTAETEVDPDAEPVEAPVATTDEVETLTDLLAQPEVAAPAEPGADAPTAPKASEAASAAASEAQAGGELVPLAKAPVSPEAVDSVTTVLTDKDTRSSTQEFAAAPVQVAPGKKNKLSNLEKVGLVALGALAVGVIIKGANERENRQVVSNTGDRVVVLNPDGTHSIYKDDDAVLRRPGNTVRTETFKDGSTRTIVERADGSQVVTIRNATGRVLRRATYDHLGREMVLIDDLADEVPVRVNKLPRPVADRVTISAKDENAALKARLAAREAAKAGRTFSLRQVRDIPEVRALAATIDAGTLTFDSGSAAIRASEADALADLGTLIQDLLAENPAEVFLIEGHTDATGKAAMNLALSDRRAESVALALTEYFDIAPENLVVQGYGEGELLIPTQADERRNRRVAVRVITPLLRVAP